MLVSVSVAVTMKTESQDGVCICAYDSDDRDGVVGWCSCVCGCENDTEWIIQHLEIFLVILPGENKLLMSRLMCSFLPRQCHEDSVNSQIKQF